MSATETHSDQPMRKAKRRGLNRLSALRNVLVDLKRAYLTRLWGIDLHPTAHFSLSAKFGRTFPVGFHVGAGVIFR